PSGHRLRREARARARPAVQRQRSRGIRAPLIQGEAQALWQNILRSTIDGRQTRRAQPARRSHLRSARTAPLPAPPPGPAHPRAGIALGCVCIPTGAGRIRNLPFRRANRSTPLPIPPLPTTLAYTLGGYSIVDFHPVAGLILRPP